MYDVAMIVRQPTKPPKVEIADVVHLPQGWCESFIVDIHFVDWDSVVGKQRQYCCIEHVAKFLLTCRSPRLHLIIIFKYLVKIRIELPQEKTNKVFGRFLL